MEYSIGQHFPGIYPPEAAMWCNANNAMMVTDGDGYSIAAVPEPDAPTGEELFAQLRARRDARLTEYDTRMAQLLREARAGCDVAAAIAAWDAYAAALCDLPAKEGAPWDGGGAATPWPEMPAAAVPGRETACA